MSDLGPVVERVKERDDIPVYCRFCSTWVRPCGDCVQRRADLRALCDAVDPWFCPKCKRASGCKCGPAEPSLRGIKPSPRGMHAGERPDPNCPECGGKGAFCLKYSDGSYSRDWVECGCSTQDELKQAEADRDRARAWIRLAEDMHLSPDQCSEINKRVRALAGGDS